LAQGSPNCPLIFTAVISLEPHGNRTKYTALVIHADPESRKKHEEMGFHEGWGSALDQLVAAAKEILRIHFYKVSATISSTTFQSLRNERDRV
jgi:hypothetical protein